MRTLATLLFAASAALTISAPVSASVIPTTSEYRIASAPVGFANVVGEQGVPKGRTCPTDRPYQCL